MRYTARQCAVRISQILIVLTTSRLYFWEGEETKWHLQCAWVYYCCWTLQYLFIIVSVMPGLFFRKGRKKRVGQNVFYTRSHVRLSRAPRLRKKIFGLWFSTHNTTFQQHNGYKKSFSTNKKLMQPCVCYLANIHST